MVATLSKSTMQQLATAARRGDRKALGDVLSSLGYGGGFAEYAGTPGGNITPDRKGQELLNTTDGTWYRAKGLANTDWVPLGDPDISLAELTYLDITSLGTGAASKAVVLDSSSNYIWPTGGFLTYKGTQITATGAEFNYLDLGGSLGTAEGSKALTLTSNKELTWATTSASSSNVEPFVFTSTMTGSGTGGRAKFALLANSSLGAWANALKAITTFNASGSVTGIGSAFVGELVLSAGTTSGTYAALEAELVLPSGAKTGTATSFLYCNVSGADKATFDTSGFLFEIGAGITAGDTKLFAAGNKSGIAKTHTLKVKIDGTIYYMPLHTAQNCGGT